MRINFVPNVQTPLDHQRLARRVRVALGQEPGDLVLTGGHVVNVFTQRVEAANVVIADGWIAGVGPFDWRARETADVRGFYLIPGLIDAHIHVESTLLTPAELARVIVPHGTTALIADPHEVVNVLGVAGVDLLAQASEGVPLDLFFMASSCVPASRWEEAGATVGPAEVRELLRRPRVLGLAEMMNFPAVLGGDAEVLDKVIAGWAAGRAVDGHAPGLSGRELIAYVAAGIRSDHESTTVEEAKAKAALGMMVQVREGSAEHNLDTLLPLMVADELGDWCLASDDVMPDDLLRLGHLDAVLARVVAAGVPAARAVRHATLVPARHYGLTDRGGVAPGHIADVVVVEDLKHFRPHLVLKDGRIVARDGNYQPTGAPPRVPHENTVRLGPLSEASFHLRLAADTCPTVGIVPGQIVTTKQTRTVTRTNGEYGFDPKDDLLICACVERHHATGHVGLGLVTGFGLKRHGALGSSVGHDAHNLVLAGSNPRDLLAAARALEKTGGGFVVVRDGAVTAQLPLPIAGLLSEADAGTVCAGLDAVHTAAKELGCTVNSPFGILSFLALSVIPELRVTTHGLFDVLGQKVVQV